MSGGQIFSIFEPPFLASPVVCPLEVSDFDALIVSFFNVLLENILCRSLNSKISSLTEHVDDSHDEYEHNPHPEKEEYLLVEQIQRQHTLHIVCEQFPHRPHFELTHGDAWELGRQFEGGVVVRQAPKNNKSLKATSEDLIEILDRRYILIRSRL